MKFLVLLLAALASTYAVPRPIRPILPTSPLAGAPVHSTFGASLANAPVGLVDRNAPGFGSPFAGFPFGRFPYGGFPFGGYPYNRFGENLFTSSLGDAKVGAVSKA